MEFFASLVLDRIGIALQVADVLVEAIVFLLKLQHLLLEDFCFFAFVRKGSEAVVTEDNAVRHDEGKCAGRDGSSTTTPQIDAALGSPRELGQLYGELRFG